VAAAVLCLGLVVSAGALAISAQPPLPPSSDAIPATTGPEAGYRWYLAKADEWRSEARMLRTLQVLFVVMAVGSSVLAASKIVLPVWFPTWLLPVTAALSVALFTGLDINTQANKQRDAWRHLTAALAAYRDGDGTIELVRNAYVEAEAMIGAYNPQAPKR
jgi:hypothetical protein